MAAADDVPRRPLIRPHGGERNAHRGEGGAWRWHAWACLLCGAQRSYPTGRCGSCSRRGIVSVPVHVLLGIVAVDASVRPGTLPGEAGDDEEP